MCNTDERFRCILLLNLLQISLSFSCVILDSALNRASAGQRRTDSGALLFSCLTTLWSRITRRKRQIYSGTGAAPVRRGSPPTPTAAGAISINQISAQKATGEKTRLKSALKNQIDVKYEDLSPRSFPSLPSSSTFPRRKRSRCTEHRARPGQTVAQLGANAEEEDDDQDCRWRCAMGD